MPLLQQEGSIFRLRFALSRYENACLTVWANVHLT